MNAPPVTVTALIGRSGEAGTTPFLVSASRKRRRRGIVRPMEEGPRPNLHAAPRPAQPMIRPRAARWLRFASRPLAASLLAVAAVGAGSPTDAEEPTEPLPIGQEGPLRNGTPLPRDRAAEDALARGDARFRRALAAAPEDRAGELNPALDAWQEALDTTRAGAAVRLVLDPTQSILFPTADGTSARRSEGIETAIWRRLESLSAAERGAWVRRFSPAANAALERAFQGVQSGSWARATAAFGRVARGYPGTLAGARAALAAADVALEEGRPVAATAWLMQVERHVGLLNTAPETADAAPGWPEGSARAMRAAAAGRSLAADTARRALRYFDHTAPQATVSAEGPPSLRPVNRHRITGIARGTDEPFGRGLGSGVAFFGNGQALIQGAVGLLLLDADGTTSAAGSGRTLIHDLLGTSQPIVRAAPSAGGWIATPASDGSHVVLVHGRGERPRPFQDIVVPPQGNVLAYVRQGGPKSPIEPLWVMRDGVRVERPMRRDTRRRTDDRRERALRGGPGNALDSTRGGALVDGWSFGRGWEFQPGPVLADGRIHVLARGLGDATDGEDDHADEVRLMALDADSGALIWSREVTSERGLTDQESRGSQGFLAATTMPLGIDRATGTLLVGTNVGLVAGYSVADGRLQWAFQTQRRRPSEQGWPGSRAPILIESEPGSPGGVAWFAPFDSESTYALLTSPTGADGRLLAEAPRSRDGATDLAAVLPPEGASEVLSGDHGLRPRSTLVLLGRDGRHAAILLDRPGDARRAGSYLSPQDRFTGSAGLIRTGLLAAGAAEIAHFNPAADFALDAAAPIRSGGAGRGGAVAAFGELILVVGRDTVWVWSNP